MHAEFGSRPRRSLTKERAYTPHCVKKESFLPGRIVPPTAKYPAIRTTLDGDNVAKGCSSDRAVSHIPPKTHHDVHLQSTYAKRAISQPAVGSKSPEIIAGETGTVAKRDPSLLSKETRVAAAWRDGPLLNLIDREEGRRWSETSCPWGFVSGPVPFRTQDYRIFGNINNQLIDTQSAWMPIPHKALETRTEPSYLSQSSAGQPPRQLKYACHEQECDKSFARPSELTKHQRVHKDPTSRPYSCHDCNQSFFWPKDLKRHRQSKHADKLSCNEELQTERYHCPVQSCPYFREQVFGRRDRMLRHYKRKHRPMNQRWAPSSSASASADTADNYFEDPGWNEWILHTDMDTQSVMKHTPGGFDVASDERRLPSAPHNACSVPLSEALWTPNLMDLFNFGYDNDSDYRSSWDSLAQQHSELDLTPWLIK